ncbi:MAG: HupE/UreJ family protein [Steroidobacteraceae bacterium]
MNKTVLRTLLRFGALLALPAIAAAHPGHPGHESFAAGFAHPLSGVDHLLAMLAVGLWAAQLGGRARWAVPAAFVVLMLAGGALGRAGVWLPQADAVIAASVLVLGLLVAALVRLPTVAAMAVVGAFALFHGYAHGVEMPLSAQALPYVAGFAAATAALHAVGLGLGVLAARLQPRLLRLAGAATALAGALLLA